MIAIFAFLSLSISHTATGILAVLQSNRDAQYLIFQVGKLGQAGAKLNRTVALQDRVWTPLYWLYNGQLGQY